MHLHLEMLSLGLAIAILQFSVAIASAQPSVAASFASSGSGAGAGSIGSYSYLCTPYELARKPQECFQRSVASVPTFATPTFWNPGQFASPPSYNVFDTDTYFKQWRQDFDAWQRNFQTQLQESLRRSFAEAQANREEILKNAQRGKVHSSFHSQSSSSFGDSTGTSESVMHSSDNSGSYTIRSSGLGVSSSSVNGKKSIKVHLPHPNSTLETKIINDQEMMIDVVSPNDSTKRWVSIKITSGTSTVQNYHVSRPNDQTILIQNN